jgi:hypothetical protein
VGNYCEAGFSGICFGFLSTSLGSFRFLKTSVITAQAKAVIVPLSFFKTATAPEGTDYIVYGDKSSDKAGYAFTLLLL